MWMDMDAIISEQNILHAAWALAYQHQQRFRSDPSNPCVANLTRVLKMLKRLRHLRIAFCWWNSSSTPTHKLWLRMELGDKLLAEHRYLLDRYNMFSGDDEQQMPDFDYYLDTAIVASGIQLQSI